MSTPERFLVMASACCLATLVAGGAPMTEPGDGNPITTVAAAPAVNYKNLKMKRLNPRVFTPMSGGVLVAADAAEPSSGTRIRPAPSRTRPATLYWVSDADAAAATAAEWRRGATFRF